MSEKVDLRKIPRADAELSARISSLSGEADCDAVVCQLGLCGCMVRGARSQGEAGRVVRLSIDVEGRSVNAIAKVLYEYRSEGHVFTGFQFESLDDGQGEVLKAFVSGRGSPTRC